MRNVESSAQDTASGMNAAFEDLEGLMVKARDMVRLAGELNERLGMAGTVEPEEAVFIRSSMSKLGLQMGSAAVTADMIRDERGWMDELGKELAKVLQGEGGLMGERGMIGLDEVWCGWNRARGIALIPPSTFLGVLGYVGAHTRPRLSVREFSSGLLVLESSEFGEEEFDARISSRIQLLGPQSTKDIAREEKVSMYVASELILKSEKKGIVCRDFEVWYLNILSGHVWDGDMRS